MQRLLITRRLPDRVLEAARARFDVTLRDRTEVLSPDELRAALRDYDAVLPTLGDRFQPDVFADVPEPRAKILANFGVGYNHIDAAAAKAAGLAVTNTPGAVTDATADIALSLILMTARRLGEGERILRAGGWEGWGPVQMLGTHVTGKTCRDHRLRADRQGDCQAVPLRLRHGGGVPQPLPRGRPRPARAAGGDG